MRVSRWATARGLVLLGTSLLLLSVPTHAVAQQVDWEKINPAFRGASFVNNDKTCLDCHEETAHKFDASQHAQYYRAGDTPVKAGCESCHGPRSKHVDDEKPLATWSTLTKVQQSTVCLQCHAKGPRMAFKTGPHLAGDVSCTSCHDAKQPVGQVGMLVRARTAETCYSCHNNVRGQLNKVSHHPVREGKLDCISCHNVHGSNPSLLKTATLNETCNSCHTEKRGPFVWEHAPVRESCANCHDSHGSNNRKLLNKKESFVCMQCHSYGGHINLPRYNRTSNAYGDGCVNCHTSVHGSNHPSGVKLTR